ncbi:hypothetical protein DFP73DRAFT_530099 [Morchella snyderi]|nr:hypothetical protein DFP73DRAFT_530099 [Morchella snyderi]
MLNGIYKIKLNTIENFLTHVKEYVAKRVIDFESSIKRAKSFLHNVYINMCRIIKFHIDSPYSAEYGVYDAPYEVSSDAVETSEDELNEEIVPETQQTPPVSPVSPVAHHQQSSITSSCRQGSSHSISGASYSASTREKSLIGTSNGFQNKYSTISAPRFTSSVRQRSSIGSGGPRRRDNSLKTSITNTSSKWQMIGHDSLERKRRTYAYETPIKTSSNFKKTGNASAERQYRSNTPEAQVLTSTDTQSAKRA